MAGLSGRALIASRCAKFFKDGDFVNLGIGVPTMCVNYLPEGVNLWLNAEIGIVGCGPTPDWDDVDPDLIDAGGNPTSIITGGAVVDHAKNFGMIRRSASSSSKTYPPCVPVILRISLFSFISLAFI